MTLAEAHILLVDDEPVLRMTLGMVLRRQGATVTEAGSGAEALRLLQGASAGGQTPTEELERPVDLLLTDWHMPELDGPALLQALADVGRTLPAVLCTGTSGDADQRHLSLLGVRAVVLKPFLPAELLATLEAVLAPLPVRS